MNIQKEISMHIEVSTDNSIEGSEALNSLIRGLVVSELARLDYHLTRIEVHLSKARSASTGQEEMHCVIEGRLKGRKPVVANDTATTLEKAAKGAAGKLKSSLDSTLGKLSDNR
ncbi:HPF/RaiA family ribosome-associated protein [Shimia thalassica]|uniref:HPF/RaiA family ribosome-associated protein n=2 Tax=Shimia thalassica TaxID=1715693 RepID=UPI002732C317|nr:HPF/RaiA family ribosome-associated protein [Shimia thalassica]